MNGPTERGRARAGNWLPGVSRRRRVTLPHTAPGLPAHAPRLAGITKEPVNPNPNLYARVRPCASPDMHKIYSIFRLSSEALSFRALRQLPSLANYQLQPRERAINCGTTATHRSCWRILAPTVSRHPIGAELCRWLTFGWYA